MTEESFENRRKLKQIKTKKHMQVNSSSAFSSLMLQQVNESLNFLKEHDL